MMVAWRASARVTAAWWLLQVHHMGVCAVDVANMRETTGELQSHSVEVGSAAGVQAGLIASTKLSLDEKTEHEMKMRRKKRKIQTHSMEVGSTARMRSRHVQSDSSTARDALAAVQAPLGTTLPAAALTTVPATTGGPAEAATTALPAAAIVPAEAATGNAIANKDTDGTASFGVVFVGLVVLVIGIGAVMTILPQRSGNVIGAFPVSRGTITGARANTRMTEVHKNMDMAEATTEREEKRDAQIVAARQGGQKQLSDSGDEDPPPVKSVTSRAIAGARASAAPQGRGPSKSVQSSYSVRASAAPVSNASPRGVDRQPSAAAATDSLADDRNARYTRSTTLQPRSGVGGGQNAL